MTWCSPVSWLEDGGKRYRKVRDLVLYFIYGPALWPSHTRWGYSPLLRVEDALQPEGSRMLSSPKTRGWRRSRRVALGLNADGLVRPTLAPRVQKAHGGDADVMTWDPWFFSLNPCGSRMLSTLASRGYSPVRRLEDDVDQASKS